MTGQAGDEEDDDYLFLKVDSFTDRSITPYLCYLECLDLAGMADVWASTQVYQRTTSVNKLHFQKKV